MTTSPTTAPPSVFDRPVLQTVDLSPIEARVRDEHPGPWYAVIDIGTDVDRRCCGDTHTTRQAAIDCALAAGARLPLGICTHQPPPVQVDTDQWMGRLASHLELLLRHADTLQVDIDGQPHLSVAREMARACLTDYHTLRAQQQLVDEIAAKPCRSCELQTLGVR